MTGEGKHKDWETGEELCREMNEFNLIGRCGWKVWNIKVPNNDET